MMRQQEILKKIGGIIAELKDQYTYLETAGSSFNELELELFMANAHFLTDHIGILQKINQQPVISELPAAKPVLQLEETPQKPIIPDYFDAQDLLSVAESDQFEKDTIKTAETPSPILPFAETIILPEVMPQAEADLSPQETIILPEVMPQLKFTEDAKPDASFINPKLETEISDKSFGLNDTTSAENAKPDASFIDPKLETVDLHDESFELNDTTSAENAKPDASFINLKSETGDLQGESFGLNPVSTPPAARPETLSMNTQQSAASDFSISSGSETNSRTEPTILTLNDRIAAQKDADQLKTKPDQPKSNQDLQAMINLNDKLLFVKELFNGYNLAYTEAINILNRYTSFNQAENFLNINYAAKNNWKDKPVTTEKFMDLLRRKLG